MREIQNKEAFERWARKEKGKYWYLDYNIISYYGFDQLKSLFPELVKEPKDVGNIFNVAYSFKLSDVNINEGRLNKETSHIYNKPNKRKGRTYDQVKTSVKLGHSLEQFLIDNHGFKDDTRDFMDVISSDGSTVECKVTYKESNINKMVMEVQKRQEWVPVKTDYLIAYKTDGVSCTYQKTIKIKED